MGSETEEILEQTEGSGVEIDEAEVAHIRVRRFTANLDTGPAIANDSRLEDFCDFLAKLMRELNSEDSEMFVYPTRDSIMPFLESLDRQVLVRYGVVLAWMASVDIMDIEQEDLLMTIHLMPYEFADIFGYKLQ
jgi:hypothetical protein|uniref:Uncharacterized protein n=1 Tax=Myoviridae sp. ctshb19 TaxID=2825194 RepID=A0A8S5UGV3_9CAUD|nr:MAG TPA: hypothetical protein [Myoviridae sp. ctshb19]